MLLKEYRIILPLTVEEYRIAQLYMILKKSRQMTKSAGSAVEIIKNEPYTDGPGGAGQFTHKLLHIEEHLPGWLKALLPKSAMVIEEQAWNAYPYTKTKYVCSFIERFVLDIETVYRTDDGNAYNVFNLGPKLLSRRIVDYVDIVNDSWSQEYKVEEDPTKFVSKKTKRGPLLSDWKDHLTENNRMCAYKLCKVEFRYWGLQAKIEQFIHEVALRRTILSAHRAAWCWQDEWIDLTLNDIRRMEQSLQEELQQKISNFIFLKDDDASDVKFMDSPVDSTQAFGILSDDSTDEYFDALSSGGSSEDIALNRNDNLPLNWLPGTILKFYNCLDEFCADSSPNDAIDYLILLYHTGSFEFSERESDLETFEQTLQRIIRSHFESFAGHIAVRLVSCELFCEDIVKQLSRLSTTKTTSARFLDSLALFVVSHPNYWMYVNLATNEANAVFNRFCAGSHNFNGGVSSVLFNVCVKMNGKIHLVIIVGDALGAIIAYDCLTSYEREGADSSLIFKVNSFFCFGSPLGLVLLQRLLKQTHYDPFAFRIEPILFPPFHSIPPVVVPRFNHARTAIKDFACSYEKNSGPFDLPAEVSGNPLNVEDQWWGTRRIDYTLYAPASLIYLPIKMFSMVMHSSYWENYDDIAFMLQMIFPSNSTYGICKDHRGVSKLGSPHFSYLKKNSSMNHRTNDVISLESSDQIIRAKFFYNPLDVLTLNSNKIDVFYQPLPTISQNNMNDWKLLGTKESDSRGKFVFKLPNKLRCGVYAVKMFIREDSSSVFSTLFVLPPHTATAIFSINGSLRTSFSVRERDPKIQAGAVDVVRFWQRTGHLILYVSARPEIQLSRVFRWLALHNFPRGPVILSDSITSIPLRHKLEQLKTLCSSAKLCIKAAYGSIKDIPVYSACGISNDKIFVVGKAKSKQLHKAHFISDGYAAHLTYLTNVVEKIRPTSTTSVFLHPTSDKFSWFPNSIQTDINMF